MSYPSNNIYNLHHRKIVDLIIAPDSRLYTAYFNLTAADVANFELNNIIYIDGLEYTVNKIQDYNAAGRNFTKIELVTHERT